MEIASRILTGFVVLPDVFEDLQMGGDLLSRTNFARLAQNIIGDEFISTAFSIADCDLLPSECGDECESYGNGDRHSRISSKSNALVVVTHLRRKHPRHPKSRYHNPPSTPLPFLSIPSPSIPSHPSNSSPFSFVSPVCPLLPPPSKASPTQSYLKASLRGSAKL